MHRYGIEDESWFEAARTGLERRGFKLRIQPRSIIIDKEARLPRIVGGAREFLEFAERQGLAISAAAYAAADRYGDSRSDLSGRVTASPFETPPADAGVGAGMRPVPLTSFGGGGGGVLAETRPASLGTVELRLAELRAEHERAAAERLLTQTLAQEKEALKRRCEELETEIVRLTSLAAEAEKQRDLYQMSAAAAEERLRLTRTEADPPAAVRGVDRRFDQLRRYLARELHPDLAGENSQERALREALFKRVWAKIEQIQ